MWKSQILLVLALCHHLASASDTSSPDLTGHLKPFGAQGPVSEIEHVDGFLPPKEFLNNFVAKNRPVLFKGAAKSSPAFTKWTDEYLMAKTPPRPAGDVHFERGKKENRSDEDGYVHFKDFLRDYNTSNIYVVSVVPDFLHDDLILPYPLQCGWFVKTGLVTSMLWFSSGGTSSVIHYDAYENINCLFRGRKNLLLLNPYRYGAQIKKIIDDDDRAVSSADVDRIDVEKRPEFAGLEFNSVSMEPGDCVYIPVHWVHQTRSFDSNLAVNVWWLPQDKYDTTKCFNEFKSFLSFDLVYFASQVQNIREDFDIFRIVLSKMDLPITEEELLIFLSAGDVKAIVTVMPKLPAKVMSLFKSLDSNKDGLLSVDELEADVEYSTIVKIRKIILEYNTAVFAMHQAAGNGTDVDKLPKLIPIDGSDESFYAPERTWKIPQLPEDMQPSSKDNGDSVAKPDTAKDEL